MTRARLFGEVKRDHVSTPVRRILSRAALTSWLALACAPSAANPAPTAPDARPRTPEAARADQPNDARGVRVHVRVEGSEAEVLRVELVARGPSEELAELRLTSTAHGAIAELELSDAAGPVPFTAAPDDEALIVRLARRARGELSARYRVESTIAGFDDAVATTLGPDRLRLSGETALLLPTAFDGAALHAELRFDLTRLLEGSTVASSLGRDLSALRCTGAELRHASFIAGRLQTARFVTDDGTDEWYWLDALGFDARPVSGETAALRSELARYFEARPPSPYVVLASAGVRPNGGFGIVSRSGGLLLDLPVDVPWPAPVRIAVCRELFRPWLGGEVRLVGEGERASARELWFNEGVARALARELLFGFAMLTPEEYRVEINGIIGGIVLSPLAAAPIATLVEHSAADLAARRLLMARGALYATLLGARLRAAGAGARALDPIVRELFTVARAERRALRLGDWHSAVAKHAGPGAEREFQRLIEAGQVYAPPANGLGPCFRVAPQRYVEFSLGFDLAGSRGRDAVLALQQGGPAARAGLRATDRVVAAHYLDGDPTQPVRVELMREGKPMTLRYLPVGRRVEGPGWVRRSDIPDAACNAG